MFGLQILSWTFNSIYQTLKFNNKSAGDLNCAAAKDQRLLSTNRVTIESINNISKFCFLENKVKADRDKLALLQDALSCFHL